MKKRLLTVKARGGFEIEVSAERVKALALLASTDGTLYLKVNKTETPTYWAWMGTKERKDVSVTVANVLWTFTECCPTSFNSDRTEMIFVYQQPKKDGRVLYEGGD